MASVSRLAPSYNVTPSSEGITPPPSYRASVLQTSSLDLSQRFEKKLAEYNASQNILKRWLFEITSLTISAVCMVRIIFSMERFEYATEQHSPSVLRES